jgi:hypothetical protein
MIRKMSICIFVVFSLVGCIAQRSQTRESQRSTQSGPVSRSETAIPEVGSNSVGTVQIFGGDEDTLREFIQRWFAPLYTESEGGTSIWIGKLPDDFAVNFPLPEGAQVFASIQGPYTAIQVLVDVPTSPDEVLASYQQMLTDAGWLPAPDNSQWGGFVSATDTWLIYCKSDEQTEEQAALTVQAFSTASGQTELRLNLSTTDTQYTCEPDSSQPIDQAYIMIPTLTVPSRAVVISGGSASSGKDSAESSSDFRTSLSPQELVDHFFDQLQVEGWKPLDQGDAESFSWSTWSITDDQGDQWSGILIVLDNPVSQDLVYASMRVFKLSK